jgi:hypothetical protein
LEGGFTIVGDAPSVLEETARWRARDVRYLEGTWRQLRDKIPEFEMKEFRAEPAAPANPYFKAVVRRPQTSAELPIPVGIVSNRYTLASHAEVAERCLEGFRAAGVETSGLRCQLGLTELGEWMHLRIYFPEDFDHAPRDGRRLSLRLECFNSVDGSSRLVLLLGWLRLVCSNGLVIGETRAELRDVHDQTMDLTRIPTILLDALTRVKGDRERLSTWERTSLRMDRIGPWADGVLTQAWGKKAACRGFHICTSGFDVELNDPFAAGPPTTKPVSRTQRVPGAPDCAQTLYDASQALSWIASSRRNADERIEWQAQIPELITALNGVL